MKLLICAQTIDSDDPTLSFFLGWIEELSTHFEFINIICLKEGAHELPPNVHVHSLGKENATGSRFSKRIRYVARLWKLIRDLRDEYDAVFVHQNQEYILSAGFRWRKYKKPIYFWRNHYEGNMLTTIAARFCTKIFYTSQYSYTKRYDNAIQMPVGVDTELFSTKPGVERPRRSIVFLARIAPSKRAHLLLEALGILYGQQVAFQTSIYGNALPQDVAYHDRLKEHVRTGGLAQFIRFYEGVPHGQVADIFRENDIFVNLSKSGMLDKTIFEAAASGCAVLVASKDLKENVDPRSFVDSESADDIAKSLRSLLELTDAERSAVADMLHRYVLEEHSLRRLGQMLAEQMA